MDAEESLLVATVRAFIDRDVKPTVRDVEHADEYPEAWIEQMKQIGIYGLAIPESYGGSPVSTRCYAHVTQELSRGWMSLAGAMGGHTVVAKLLTLFGTEEQKRAYLPTMATGELRATMALTEPGGGSDLQNLKTTALARGEDSTVLVINGSKTWISNARRCHAGARGNLGGACGTGTGRPGPGHRVQSRPDGVAGSSQAWVQGRRDLRAELRGLPRARVGDSGRCTR
jgi:butyryl-CoA dehydrogenase